MLSDIPLTSCGEIHDMGYESNGLHILITGGNRVLGCGTIGIGCPRMYSPALVPKKLQRMLSFGDQERKTGVLVSCR